jgi:hypothetical protein
MAERNANPRVDPRAALIGTPMPKAVGHSPRAPLEIPGRRALSQIDEAGNATHSALLGVF